MYNLKYRHYEPPDIAPSGSNPHDFLSKYMNDFFRKDLEKFMDMYIKDNDEPDLLPQGLIDEFTYRLIHPAINDMVINIKCERSDLTRINGHKCFKKTVEINKINVPVIINKTNLTENEIEEILTQTDGIDCIVTSGITINEVNDLAEGKGSFLNMCLARPLL